MWRCSRLIARYARLQCSIRRSCDQAQARPLDDKHHVAETASLCGLLSLLAARAALHSYQYQLAVVASQLLAQSAQSRPQSQPLRSAYPRPGRRAPSVPTVRCAELRGVTWHQCVVPVIVSRRALSPLSSENQVPLSGPAQVVGPVWAAVAFVEQRASQASSASASPTARGSADCPAHSPTPSTALAARRERPTAVTPWPSAAERLTTSEGESLLC